MATRKLARLITAAAALGLSMAMVGAAIAVPNTISYVGELSTNAGTVNGTANIMVSLWDAPTGGNQIWGPQMWNNHPVSDGIFRLEIGGDSMPAIGPLLVTNDAIYATISVNGEALMPRQSLGSAAFAIIADNTRELGGLAASEYVTATQFGSTPSNAAAAAMPPANPAAGALWFNTDDESLYAWDSGTMEWIELSAGNVAADELPPDGLNELSAGMLSNEFFGVSHLNSSTQNIPDATNIGDGQPATQAVTVTEGNGSYITKIEIFTNFTLGSSNDVQVRLFPPITLGGPITLREGIAPFGTYGEVWTTATTPELADLLNQNPSGEWTLAIVDRDNNQIDSGDNLSGTLNSFEVKYDIVRADQVAANGLLETTTINAADPIGGEALLNINGTVSIPGDVEVQGQFIRNVQLFNWYQDEQASSGASNTQYESRTTTFTKRRDDTVLNIAWNETTFEQTTNNFYWFIRIDGKDCDPPLRWYHRTYNSSNGYDKEQKDFVGYCEKLSGESEPIAAGEHEMTFHCTRTEPRIGWNNAFGFLSIEEVYTAPSP